jgi:hypothetical protein
MVPKHFMDWNRWELRWDVLRLGFGQLCCGFTAVL